MKHAVLLFVLLLAILPLAACAPETRTEAASDRCARQANDDPVYKADLAKSAGSLEYQWQYGVRMEAERNAAISRCLNGVSGHRGGVERAS